MRQGQRIETYRFIRSLSEACRKKRAHDEAGADPYRFYGREGAGGCHPRKI